MQKVTKLVRTTFGLFCIIEDYSGIGTDVYIGNYVHIRPGAKIGRFSEIRDYCFLAEGCEIGENTRVYQYANIGSGVKIGDNCFVGAKTILTNDKNLVWPKLHADAWEKTPAVVEDGVRIGVGAVILPGVTLRSGSVIGAGAVISRDTEPGKTYIGVPARELK